MQEFHAGRAAVSLAFTLKLIAAALCAAPIGWLTDRYGPRRVILIGTGIFGSILFANRVFSGSIAEFYCFYVLLGLSVRGCWPYTVWDFGIALVRQTFAAWLWA